MLLLLPCVTLCPFSQIARIMLQSLADIILRLVKGNILRDILSYLIPTQHNSLTLIGFLLRHYGLYGFGCELLFFKHLSHTDCLVVGRSAVVKVDLIYQFTRTVLNEKRNLKGRSHFHSALVHKIKQFGDKIGQANISVDLISAITGFLCDQFIGS